MTINYLSKQVALCSLLVYCLYVNSSQGSHGPMQSSGKIAEGITSACCLSWYLFWAKGFTGACVYGCGSITASICACESLGFGSKPHPL